jgi:cytochrome P450
VTVPWCSFSTFDSANRAHWQALTRSRVLRISGGVSHPDGPVPCWVLTRRSDVVAALRDTDTFLAERPFRGGVEFLPSNVEGEAHTALRRAVARLFGPGAAARLRPALRAMVGELLDEGHVGGDEQRDDEQLAAAFGARAVTLMLGLPRQDDAFLIELARNASTPRCLVGEQRRLVQWLRDVIPHALPGGVVAGLLAVLNEDSEIVGLLTALVTAGRQQHRRRRRCGPGGGCR